MSFIKKFENYMSREEMCDVLCRNGYTMSELENCPTQELEAMCRGVEDHNMDNAHNQNSNASTNEAKSEKWIQKAIKNPGALKKSMGKKDEDKISKKEIDSELAALKSKDKDKSKKGVQGLSKKDLTKFRRLNLAKTLKNLKEHQETQNYMFFANLENMKRYIDAIMELPENEVDNILSEHDWASDHISVACENLEHVHNFLLNHGNPKEDSQEYQPQQNQQIVRYQQFK
jgi:hypothetical protein